MKKLQCLLLLIIITFIGCSDDDLTNDQGELTKPEIIEEIQIDDGNMRILTKEEAPELAQLFTFSRGASIINSDINLPKELEKVDLNNIMEVYD